MEQIIMSLFILALIVHLASADKHSLEYIFTGVTPGTSIPEFTAVGQVDGEQGGCYDSKSRKVILKAEWIKDNDDVEHWNQMTQEARGHQGNFKIWIPSLMKRFNQTEGIHTWQRMHGCELHDDGTKKAYMQYGYDGEDWLILDLSTVTWTAANDKAVSMKLMWERAGYANSEKNFLENTCIEYLKKYVEYGREVLERRVSPEVSLFQKDPSSPVVCHATGFFPKPVMIYWQKNGEDVHEDVELRETLPNQDRTFQRRSILTVSAEELDKHDYTCVIQHSSLEKELVLHVSDHRGGGSFGIIVGAAVAVLFVVTVIGVLVWRRRRLKKPGFQRVLVNPHISSVASQVESMSTDTELTQILDLRTEQKKEMK